MVGLHKNEISLFCLVYCPRNPVRLLARVVVLKRIRIKMVTSKCNSGRIIEAPCSKLQGISKCKDDFHFLISLANPAASSGECARYAFSIFLGTSYKLSEVIS